MVAAIELTFRPAFGGRGRYLQFSNLMTGAEGRTFHFLAEALYHCDETGSCRGHWYDSRGMVLPLVTANTPESLVVDWGSTETEQGRTTYSVRADGTLAISDEVRTPDGEWKTFGTTVAERRGDG